MTMAMSGSYRIIYSSDDKKKCKHKQIIQVVGNNEQRWLSTLRIKVLKSHVGEGRIIIIYIFKKKFLSIFFFK
jgi:hypothetical protein